MTASVRTHEELALLKTVILKRKKLPWIDTELQVLINKRDATYRRYNRTGKAALLEEFIDLCDEVEWRTETARNTYLQNHITDAFKSVSSS